MRAQYDIYPARAPAPLLDAATLLLVRSTPSHGWELLMTRRSAQASFVPGGYVFPGGGLDEVVGRYYTAKKPNDYAVLDDHFGTEEYGVGTRKDDTALLAKLQQAMDEMKADGSAARISTEWFGKDIIK